MDRLYIPYSEGSPARTTINGHSFIILSSDKKQLEHSLDVVGADAVVSLQQDLFSDTEPVLRDLAAKSEANVVVAPAEVALDELVRDLQHYLPWLQ